MKTIYPYFIFLPLTRKIRAYNRYLKRGGIFFRKHELVSGEKPHRHKFRIKRMKRNNRLEIHVFFASIDYAYQPQAIIDMLQKSNKFSDFNVKLLKKTKPFNFYK